MSTLSEIEEAIEQLPPVKFNELRQWIERRSKSPQMVANPQWVWCVLARLQRAGLRVPEDAAVISRGDDLFLQLSDPEVTRYAYDGPRLGRAATRLMLQVLAQPGGKFRSTVLMPEFVRGETLFQSAASL